MLLQTNERRAILILGVFVLLLALVFFLLPSFFPVKKSTLVIQELPNFSIGPDTSDQINHSSSKQTAVLKPHTFNPNTVSYEDLIAMQIPEKLAKTWINYTSKGAKFYKVDDLQKLYGMNESLYAQLGPFVEIEKTTSHSFETSISVTKATIPAKQALRININTADTTLLQKLPMIGSKRASMILKYRDLLGGFISLSQLKEVYTINDTIYDTIKSFLYIAPDYKPSTMSINLKQEKELVKHPYIRPIAKALCNYKKEHGPFRSAEALQKLYTIDEKTLERILPYINFDLE